jgi:hypothetical protein
MLFTYKAADRAVLPCRGDLIRNGGTGDIINLVVKVKRLSPENLEVHSVRYAHISKGLREMLWGARIRPFIWGKDAAPYTDWRVVTELRSADNSCEILAHLSFLEGRELYYREATHEATE